MFSEDLCASQPVEVAGILPQEDLHSFQLDELEHLPVQSVSRSHDPGHWEQFLTDSDIDHWLAKGPGGCQNHSDSFGASERKICSQTHRFTKENLYDRKANKKKFHRAWILYFLQIILKIPLTVCH